MKNIPLLLPLFIMALIILSLITCTSPHQNGLPIITGISENWQFRQAGTDRWYTASVPGTVHADLLENGQIDEIFWRTNENNVQWVEDADWEYRTVFQVDAGLLGMDVIELEFLGLDTYADVYLNGHHILSSDNMFVGYRVNCGEYLSEGENELEIQFLSPVREGMKKLEKLDYLIPATNEQAPEGRHTSVFTRKAPFHYGWDWGPRLVTSGIWRPVNLIAWNNAKIEDVYLQTLSIENNMAHISAEVEIYSLNGDEYLLTVQIDGQPAGTSKHITARDGINKVNLDLRVDNPRLWWTNGLGEPYLYDFSIILQKDGRITDRLDLGYGIRTVKLLQEPDETGHSFLFEVNGVPVFMKGANIIPSETLTPLVTDEMYQNLVENAVDANMNMLRVWGGAIYEEDYFYELCDRNGLLVWQDFMFACALQPGDEVHLENIRKEAEYNVRRLRNRASIALWCGNNENLHGWHHWGWQDLYTPEQRDFMWRTYERIFHEILPEAVSQLDPATAYWPSSPSSVGNTPADRRSGDEHDWTVWFGQQPFSNYANDAPRFVSEWGMQAFPGIHTIESFSLPEDRDIDSEVMRHRQRSDMSWLKPGFDGNDMIRWYMEMYYRVPEDFSDFTYVSQLLQAKGYRTAIESHRRSMPHCMGTLYWQLNDCWPTVSWSTVDYHNRWKASHYAVRKAFEEVIVSPVIEGDYINIYVISDRLEPFDAELTLTLMDFTGKILWSSAAKTTVNANTSSLAYSLTEASLPGGDRPGNRVLVTDLTAGDTMITTNLLYFAAPRFLELPSSDIWFTLNEADDGYEIELYSDNLEKNVFLDIPGGNSIFSDNFFDLLPGHGKTVRIRTKLTLDPETDIKILSLNELHNNR